MAERISGEIYRTTFVYVDCYENLNPSGRLYNPCMSKEIPFVSLTDLLIKMEDMHNEMNFPQSFNATRSFGSFSNSISSVAKKNASLASEIQPGKLASFSVKILFRQNTSWQGTVYWKEAKEEEPFRSVLELILLMDSACRAE